ncbi:MAG: hypothetical protein CMJ06_01330 [Pelagibacterales bacterium]|nr:hypothetical protein [Pelagibacterales bacterium]OUU63308.1 MAG: hypothetical protein CBC22_01300 [Alphaproteobacteria bacterium TMED62]|tara:strand:- start:2532 stop:3017 length:486 start_codon:yes stop_codon:yes gene_type:complete
MLNLLERNLFNKILTVIVLSTVLFSFLLEYVANLFPCKLCLYQRYLWIILLLICTLNIFKNNNKKYVEIIILFLLGVILSLSFYHSGIEFGFFKNIVSCSSDNNMVNSIEELDYIIRNTQNNNCAYPKFRVLNFSLSNLSFFFSTALFLLSLKAYKKNIFK